ncbi:TNFAIP3-interacting protein 2 isoform X2 [Salminus brasiliensis]|uniref:TNFAIP3-interacting protein 2 isoform X2 n=1 Tax=Salminus brasiliensis TaxID=930266 RepID=UPI003B82C793
MDHVKKEDDVTKLRSCSTLNTFYHETQEEMARLGQMVFAKDGRIADLQARLAKYERTCVIEGEDAVGPSKSLEIQGLQQKLKEKEQELESVRQSPEHEKDQEIQHLRTVLAERDRTQATKDVLYNSLAEDAAQLRVQLGATVRVCQELLGRLEKGHNPEHKVNEMIDSSEAARLNTVVCKLKDENQQLKKRVTYVENLNSRWQKYDLSREDYVRELCQKLKESNGLAGPGSALSPGTAAAGNTALFQQEIGRLNGLLKEKMLECERLSQERNNGSLRDHERIQMLEQQVLAYIEDFKSERADRERAQGKILDLEDEVARLQLQIHAQHVNEPQPTRRLPISLKKPSRKQTETAEPLLRNSPPEASTKRTVSQSPAQGSTDLMCPRCMTMYDDKNTVEYMNHWEECAKL